MCHDASGVLDQHREQAVLDRCEAHLGVSDPHLSPRQIHSQIAHVARTGKDGKWRAPDSLGYGEHAGAVAAITAQHLEEALTARFGLEWAPREDGNGFEIKGIAQEMMDLFSSRRRAITADVRERAARFEERYGRAPSQRELAQLAQASNFATRKGKEGALDLEEVSCALLTKPSA